MRIGRGIAAGLLALACLTGTPTGADAGDRPGQAELAAARKSLAAGKGEDALRASLEGLAAAPGHIELLAVATDAAESLGRKDEALWLAGAARLAAVAANMKTRAAAFEARMAALDPLPAAERVPLDARARALLDLGRAYVRKRHWVNAVQVLARLEGGPVGPEAEAELERIYANKVAVSALLDSDVEVPSTRTDRKVLFKAAKEDPKHATWKDAWKIESPSYTVVTNAGFELGTRLSSALEQMNAHYRKVFRIPVKPREPTPRCAVKLYGSHDLFLENEKPGRDVLGFYSPSENSVTLYDVRSRGRPLASLWSVVFHEASHQFTEMVDQFPVPSWLNEGTASYFEGAILRPDGRVETNGIPMHRLADAAEALRSGEPSVRSVIEFEQPGSYAAECYPVGWALVYFLRNYTDDAFERVYAKHYDAILDSYRKGEGGASFPRFVKHVVTAPALPGVKTYEDFEQRFREWVLDLADMHLSGSSRASQFYNRAKAKRAAGKTTDAEDDLRDALRRSPGHIDALADLADLVRGRGKSDESLSLLRRILEGLRKDGMYAAGVVPLDKSEVAALVARTVERITAIDAEIGAAVAALDRGLAGRVQAAAEAYVAKGFPRTALATIDAALPLLDGDEDLDALRTKIAEEAAVDVLLPLEVPVEAGLPGWHAGPEFSAAGGGVRVFAGEPRGALFLADLPARYRFEADVKFTARTEDAYAGLLFGCGPSGEWETVGASSDSFLMLAIGESVNLIASPAPVDEVHVKGFRLSVDVRPGLVRVHVNGKRIADQEFARDALRGGVGLYAGHATAEFRNLKVFVPTGRYFRD